MGRICCSWTATPTPPTQCAAVSAGRSSTGWSTTTTAPGFACPTGHSPTSRRASRSRISSSRRRLLSTRSAMTFLSATNIPGRDRGRAGPPRHFGAHRRRCSGDVTSTLALCGGEDAEDDDPRERLAVDLQGVTAGRGHPHEGRPARRARKLGCRAPGCELQRRERPSTTRAGKAEDTGTVDPLTTHHERAFEGLLADEGRLVDGPASAIREAVLGWRERHVPRIHVRGVDRAGTDTARVLRDRPTGRNRTRVAWRDGRQMQRPPECLRRTSVSADAAPLCRLHRRAVVLVAGRCLEWDRRVIGVRDRRSHEAKPTARLPR